MEYETYFGGKRRFQVNATNKEEAKKKGAEYIARMPGSDNVIKESLRCVKKLKPSFGKES